MKNICLMTYSIRMILFRDGKIKNVSQASSPRKKGKEKMDGKKVVTQIGSLPYDNIDDAVNYSSRHDIPFLPELPLLGDSMMDYIKNPGQNKCLDIFRQKTKGSEIVKVQCIGPATLVISGYSEDDAVSRVYEHVSAITSGFEVGEIILFLDEPALGQAGFDFKALWAPILESFNCTFGVHVCGNMNWDDMFDSDIHIISFDASLYDITKYPKYRSGKRIAWGVEAIDNVKDFQEGDLLTGPCGMGPKFFTVDECPKRLSKLKDISENLYKQVT